MIRAGGAASIPVLELDGEPSRLIDAWAGADRAVVIDAAPSGARSGDVRRFVATDAPLPAGLRGASTHDLGLADAIELARASAACPAGSSSTRSRARASRPGRHSDALAVREALSAVSQPSDVRRRSGTLKPCSRYASTAAAGRVS